MAMESSSKPLSKYRRSPDRVAFQMTDRDVEILQALNRYRYLRTGQIHELLFGDNTTQQSARRRLRNLYHHSYIARAQPFVKVGEPVPEIAYYLNTKGRAVLREHGEVVRSWRKGGEVKYQFLEHALALSGFRVKLEKAVASIDGASIGRFIPDFEMRDEAEKYVGKKRYALYRELTHPVNRKTYIVHPDALIELHFERDGKKASRLIFVEIDQGTQGLERIRDKVTGYTLYRDQALFRQFGGYSDFLLLFQAQSERRCKNILESLVDHVGGRMVRATTAAELTPQSILTEPVWRDIHGEGKRLFRGA
jgi:hypothetical protein